MTKLASIAALAAGAAITAIPPAAQAQYARAPYGYGSPYYAPLLPQGHRYYYHGVPAAGYPYSPFPYAMEHEIRYIDGMVCRTVYEPGIGRVPVACVR